MSRKRRSYFFKRLEATAPTPSPHCTSTSRNVTSLMTARFGTRRRTKGIVTNHGMPVRWSTAHYRFSRAPCTATLYRPPSLARSFASFPLSLSSSTSLPSTIDLPVSLHSRHLALSRSVSRPPAPVFHLFLFSTIIPSLPSETVTVSLARARSSTVYSTLQRRGTRDPFSPCLSRVVPLYDAITDFSRLLRRRSTPSPPHATPPPRFHTHPLNPSRSTSRQRVASYLVSSRLVSSRLVSSRLVLSRHSPSLFSRVLFTRQFLALSLSLTLHSTPCRLFE